MHTCKRLLPALAVLALLTTGAQAGDAAGGKLVVERAWARATAPGATVGAAYLVIDNRAKRSDRLLSATTPRAAAVEVHATIKDLDQVRMRRVDPLHVGAGERLVMAPGGLHVMLIGLRGPLQQGEQLPLTLRFERAGEVSVQVSVPAPGAGADPHAGHQH